MSEPNIEQLLPHRQWLRRLAAAIVGESLADDVVQETWTAALAKPPRHGNHPKAWLAQVARRLAWGRLVNERHRMEREEQYAPEEALPAPEELLERIEQHHLVTRCLTDLEEPYRATLLWRYFEGLPMSEIASRSGVPESTVRSRVQRGLERLRVSLAADQGPDWRLAVLPLLQPDASAISVAGAGTGATLSIAKLGGLLMTTQGKLIAASLLALATLFFSLRGEGTGPAEASLSNTHAVEEPGEQGPLRVPAAVAVGERSELGGVEELAEPTAIPARLAIVVLDPTGAAVEGVPLIAQSRESDAIPIELGQSNSLGLVEFDAPQSSLEISCGGGFFTLYSAEVAPSTTEDQELFLIAVPEVTLAGRVERPDGSPLDSVEVFFEWWSLANFPRELVDVHAGDLPSTVTSADGSFELKACPGTPQLELHFARESFQRFSLSCPERDAPDLLVTLQPHHQQSEAFQVITLDESGAALPDVLLNYGGVEARTDSFGEASLPWARRPVTLIAVLEGKAPYLRGGFGYEQWLAEGSPELVEVVLGEAVFEIAGQVFDPNGQPAQGIPVTVERGTPLSTGQFAEFVAQGVGEASTRELATTDRDGRFVLRGLADKSYVVSAYDPKTLACVRSRIRPGTDGVVLHFPPDSVLHDVDVQCVDEAGEPLPGLRVGIQLQVTYGKQGTFYRNDLATTDDGGEFHLDSLPVGDAWINFDGPGILRTVRGVTEEQIASMGAGPLRFVLRRAAGFRFVPSTKDPEGCSAGLMRSDGSMVSLWVETKNSRMFALLWEVSDGVSPIYQVHEGEYTLFIMRGGEMIREEQIHLGSTESVEVSVP